LLITGLAHDGHAAGASGRGAVTVGQEREELVIEVLDNFECAETVFVEADVDTACWQELDRPKSGAAEVDLELVSDMPRVAGRYAQLNEGTICRDGAVD
jgi:hypothetical protein